MAFIPAFTGSNRFLVRRSTFVFIGSDQFEDDHAGVRLMPYENLVIAVAIARIEFQTADGSVGPLLDRRNDFP